MGFGFNTFSCTICGNVDGPWQLVPGIGLVCDDCKESGKLDAELEAIKRMENDTEGINRDKH